MITLRVRIVSLSLISLLLSSSFAQDASKESGQTFKAIKRSKLFQYAKNFCGGKKWVRKFADGTNDWSIQSRVAFDFTQFRCLNYSSELVFKAPDHVLSNNYEIDLEKFCLSPADGGCIQGEISRSRAYEVVSPRNFSPDRFTATLSTKPLGYPHSWLGIELSQDVPYAPKVFQNTIAMPFSELGDQRFFIPDGALTTGLSLFLPAYIGYVATQDSSSSGGINNLNSVEIVYVLGDREIYKSKPRLSQLCPVYFNPEIDLVENEWCVKLEPPYSGNIFHLRAFTRESLDLIDDGQFNQSAQWDYAYVKLNYNVQNRDLYITSDLTSSPQDSGMIPGNDLYYLKNLGLLELSGIPDLQRPTLWCNTNRRVAMPNPVSSDAIFSEDEFRCCVSAGEVTTNSSKCCSGFSVSENGEDICKLPPATNLNVYFNNLVSSEGISSKMPNEYFTEDDFSKQTGELKLSSAIDSKLTALGQKLCSSGRIRKGAAFGHFYGEPNTGYYRQRGDIEDSVRYSIVDSSVDYDASIDTGVSPFLEGYRWNHHTYCSD